MTEKPNNLNNLKCIQINLQHSKTASLHFFKILVDLRILSKNPMRVLIFLIMNCMSLRCPIFISSIKTLIGKIMPMEP